MTRALRLPLLLCVAACGNSDGPGICATLDCLVRGGADAGPSCQKDSDCAIGSICPANHCTPGCRSTRDCPANTTCDPAHGPYGACLSNVHADGGTTPPIDASVVDSTPPPADAAIGPDGCTYSEMPVLVNGNFDTFPQSSWTLGGTAAITFSAFVAPRSAPFLALLGGSATTDSVTQSVTFPSGATGATLSGWYVIRTNEPGGAGAKDVLNFEQQDFLGWTVFGQATNQDASSVWVHFSFPLNPSFIGGFNYISGVSALLTNDATSFTTVYLDDLTLTVTVCQ